MRPQNKKELFNLRYASLRNIIKRAFGVLKRQFRILQTAFEYPYETQMALVYALCALNNFLRQESKGIDETEIEADEENSSSDDMLDGNQDGDTASDLPDNQAINQLRDKIANKMWVDYCRYIRKKTSRQE